VKDDCPNGARSKLDRAAICHRSHVRTGICETNTRARASSATEAHIGSNNDKAVWQELGTSRGIPPRPFLAGALHHKADEVVLIIGDEIEGLLSTGKLPKAGGGWPHWAEQFVEHGLKHAWKTAKEAAHDLTHPEENDEGRPK
jgi:hypothetical protein